MKSPNELAKVVLNEADATRKLKSQLKELGIDTVAIDERVQDLTDAAELLNQIPERKESA